VDSGRELRGGQYQVLALLQQIRFLCDCQLICKSERLRQMASDLGVPTAPLTLSSLAKATRGADLVHVHDARTHTFGAILAPSKTLVSRRVAFSPQTNIFSRTKYRRVHHFVAVSRYVAQQLIQAGVPEEKISVIFDGVTIPEETSDLNGHLIALRTEDPAKCPDLIDQVEATLGVPIHRSSDLPRDLRTAKLMVYLSTSEGLGSGAIMASAYGVPVIASRTGGLPEVVHPHRNGWLVPNQLPVIAAQVKSALADMIQLKAMSRDGRKLAEELFSAERMGKETMRLYEKLMSRSGTRTAFGSSAKSSDSPVSNQEKHLG
jgi:hypothetical protein